ncbi:ABC transporter substrate-binding protein [Humibacillus sp. DSM 29435]|uniref:sugar ABC transporter substrate-binding protein n=1 Tax=Humibacillus sp. DSM 29435 TaxID=1869167 RepID=UPI0008724847|nr:maltose ABC transporter substrate-binding protein [Humibacillus sp. DSM 29435]OFE15852.1 ABC transporter substrate-binding protein [Humibacillus sp. DSM 29435]
MHKRVIGAMAISGVAALALSACGGSSTPSTPGTAAPAANDTSTSAAAPKPSSTTDAPVRDANVDLVIWTDADRAPTVKKIADAFGQEQGITTSVQIAVNTRQQFKDATKVGKGPDIVVGAHDWLGELVQENTVAPIQLSADTASQFSRQSINAAKFNGQNYGVPYAVENIALMRNTALAPDAPKTMDELVASGKAIKAKNPKVTNVLLQQVGKVGNAYYTYPYMSAFGGGIFGASADGGFDPKKVIVDSKGSVQGAEVLAKLGKEGVLSTNVGDDNAEGLFDAGKAPYFFTGPWATTNAKKANIKYAISDLPTLDGGGQMQPFLGVQLFYVSAKAKNAAIAQEFVTNYLTKKDVQLELFKALGRPPALTAAYDEVAASNPDVKAFFEAGKDSKPMPNIPAMNSVWGPLGQASADVIAGKAGAQARFASAQKEIVANINKG